MKIGWEGVPREKYVEQILLSEYNRYFRLAMSFVHNEADACDIVQNGAYAGTWIYRIMLNEIFRFYKDEKHISIEEVPEEGYEDNYENFDLRKALDSLPERDKAVVELRYFEDLKLEEIAEILKENVSTVKSRLYRSIEKLRLKMQEE